MAAAPTMPTWRVDAQRSFVVFEISRVEDLNTGIMFVIEPRPLKAQSMIEVEAGQLKQAIEAQHGGAATLAQSVPVCETFEGKTVWGGTVHVFDLTGHPTATRAYAWSAQIEGSTKRQFFAVLHTGPIKSPMDAVRAAIVAEQRSKSS
jgi:hypothetical protein